MSHSWFKINIRVDDILETNSPTLFGALLCQGWMKKKSSSYKIDKNVRGNSKYIHQESIYWFIHAKIFHIEKNKHQNGLVKAWIYKIQVKFRETSKVNTPDHFFKRSTKKNGTDSILWISKSVKNIFWFGSTQHLRNRPVGGEGSRKLNRKIELCHQSNLNQRIIESLSISRKYDSIIGANVWTRGKHQFNSSKYVFIQRQLFCTSNKDWQSMVKRENGSIRI